MTMSLTGTSNTPKGPPLGSRLVKACDPCHERKVKCDGTTPVCSACQRSLQPNCNVLERIMYHHEHVQRLEERVRWLERAVAEAYEEGSGITNVSTGSKISQKTMAHVVGDMRMVEEIGVLSLRGAGSYVGSMAGVTLSTLVNATLDLYDKPVKLQNHTSIPSKRKLSARAPYPPLPAARIYIARYLQEIHPWHPFLSLSSLARSLNSIFHEDQDEEEGPNETQRFNLMMIFALTSSHNKQDPYGPQEYYRSALDFLDGALKPRSLDSCNALLLLILYSLRSSLDTEDTMDCWLLTGHAVRLGIELGLTRNNYKSGMTEEQHEARRRTWWCIYAHERYVATATGRVLGIRNEGIEAAYPKTVLEAIPTTLLDFLETSSVDSIDLRPALHLLSHRRLLGDIMESVYITRARSRPAPSQEETLARVYQIQNSVVAWAEQSLNITSTGSIQRDILQLAFHQITLLLHRPSPTFPAPPPEVLDICLGAARGTIRISGAAVKSGNVKQVVPGWTGFVAVFTAGLTLAYCSWAGPDCPNAVQPGSDAQADVDLTLCYSTLKSLAGRSETAKQYLQIYQSIVGNLCKILGTTPWNRFSSQQREDDDGQAMAIVAESAGLPSTGGWELDQHALIMMDELMTATNSAPGQNGK